MSRPKTITRRRHDVCEGIGYELQFSNRARNAQIIPSDRDLARASAYAVLAFWEKLADWADRFRKANPDWTVDGRTQADEDTPLGSGASL